MKTKVIKDFKSVKLSHTSPTQSELPTTLKYNERYLRDVDKSPYWMIIPISILQKIARLNHIPFNDEGLLLDMEYSLEFEGIIFEDDSNF